MKKTFILILLISLVSISIEIDHCFIEENRCKTCLVGYTLNDDKTKDNLYCIKFDNCETFSNDGKTCTKCKDGYILKEEGTICKQDPCSHYDSETNICDTCNSNYQLNSETKICELKIDNCKIISLLKDTDCSECEKGYAWNSITHKCIEFPDCLETDETGTKCIKCKYNYYQPNEEGQCILDFCKDYDESGKCSKCESYFYLNDNFNCVYINIPFCRELNENKECKFFAGFHYYDDDVNKAKERYETGCQKWWTSDKCFLCRDEFVKDNETNICHLKCEEYSEPQCLFCEPGYILLKNDNDGIMCYKVPESNYEEKRKKEDSEESDESKTGEKTDIKEKETNNSDNSVELGKADNPDKSNNSRKFDSQLNLIIFLLLFLLCFN